MNVSFYDLSVEAYLQGLGGLQVVLDKGLAHCRQSGVDPDELVQVSFWEDMRPLQFQVQSAVHHSVGALEGLKQGRFSPPPAMEPLDYAGLQALVTTAQTRLRELSRDEVEALCGRPMLFEAGETRLPFTTDRFLLSFSLPNFYFHTATAYDLLRSKGVPLAKRHYLGRLRIEAA